MTLPIVVASNQFFRCLDFCPPPGELDERPGACWRGPEESLPSNGCSEQNLGVAAAALGQSPWHRVFHSWDLCIHPAKPYGIPNDLTLPIQAC